jgi:uncharacterized membrane protein YjgN (DUF898 family)
MRQRLEFRGSWLDIFGATLLMGLLSLVTLGIGIPWAYVHYRKTIISHTFLNEQPLQFDGKGGQLFGQMLMILLLTLITLGFYAILGFANVRILKWDAEHTILPPGQRLEFRGGALSLFGQLLLVGLLTLVTVGIYSFWGYVRIRRWVVTNSYLGGVALEYTGTGGQYLGLVLVNFLLSLITLGFYALLGFATKRELTWDCGNTLVPEPLQPQTQPWAATTAYPGTQPINVTVNVNQPPVPPVYPQR